MFDFGWAEIVIVGAIALFVIGPQDIPKIAYSVGKFFRRIKYMQYALSGQFDDFMAKAESKPEKQNLDHDPMDEAEADAELMEMLPLPEEEKENLNHGDTEAQAKIIILTKESFECAVSLITKAFSAEEYRDLPKRFLEACFKPEVSNDHDDMSGLYNRKCWITHSDAKNISGLIGLMENELDNQNAYYISWLCVDEKYRLKGLARMLLEHVERFAEEENKDFLKLWVDRNNTKLHKFYQKAGFRISKEKARVENDITMVKPLRLCGEK